MTQKQGNDAQVIIPDMLEADATVPQCLDNQYVSDEIFEDMVNQGLEYSDVNERRKRDAQTEFIRSIIYSSQVVVNRAFFVNNAFFYNNYLPEDKENVAAFAKLVKRVDNKQVIVPYLYRERSFHDEFPFPVSDDGKNALAALLNELGENITCVRLALNDEENEKLTKGIELKFGQYLTGLKELAKTENEMLLNEMAAELIGNRSREELADLWPEFKQQVKKLAAYAFNADETITRNNVYRDLFVVGESEEQKKESIVKGRFRKPDGNDPFLFEMKKLVDLRYNTNLPDFIDRFTFTPAGMPSRIALQDFSTAGRNVASNKVESVVDTSLEKFKQIKQIFVAQSQKAMQLPLLAHLTVADVVEIRQLPTWKAFSQAQQYILEHPLQIIDSLQDFQEKFEAFQSSLSNWYFDKYKRQAAGEKYAEYVNYVTMALQIAGQVIIVGVNPLAGWQKIMGNIFGLGLQKAIGIEKIKGYTVMLLVNVINREKRELDSARSYSIELMRSNSDLTGDEVKNLIQRIREVGGDQVEYSDAAQLADQGQ
jgi:hypothetical protein